MKKKKAIDLEIKTRYNGNSKFIKISPNLPKCPFYMSIIGGKGGGKTLLIANIVHKYKKYLKRVMCLFLRIHLFQHFINYKKQGDVLFSILFLIMKIIIL